MALRHYKTTEDALAALDSRFSGHSPVRHIDPATCTLPIPPDPPVKTKPSIEKFPKPKAVAQKPKPEYKRKRNSTWVRFPRKGDKNCPHLPGFRNCGNGRVRCPDCGASRVGPPELRAALKRRRVDPDIAANCKHEHESKDGIVNGVQQWKCRDCRRKRSEGRTVHL